MMDVLLQVVTRRLVFAIPLSGSLWWRDFLCFSPSSSLTTQVRLAIIGSCLQQGIDHLNRPSIPPLLFHPPNFSLAHSPPFPTISLSDLSAATLISMVNGVPSSVQTNSWINSRVQALSSLFPAEMVENSNAKRWKPRGREADRERKRWQGWIGRWTSEMLFRSSPWDAAYLFYLWLCYSFIYINIRIKDVIHTVSDNKWENN